jgi:murein DD-endopeptidase MepM/ murein hydrolase activator NlpD
MGTGRRLLVGLTAAVSAVLGSALLSGSADAAPTIDEVRVQLDQYAAEQAQIDQQVVQTQQRLINQQAQLDQTRAELDARRASVEAMQSQVVQVAMIQWQSKGMDATMIMLSSESVTTMVSQLTATQWVSTTTNELLQRYLLEQAELGDLEAAQAEVLARIEADQAELERLSAEANAKVDESTQLLAELTAEQQAALARARAAAAASAEGTAEGASGVLSNYDTSGLITSSGIIKPIDAPVSSGFGWRTSPISGASELHDGVDYGAPCGTPVWAAANGVVVRVEYYYGYGNRVVIDHGIVDGHQLATSYNHLSSFATTVGAEVQQGELIAYVGATGQVTGCHLHFCVYIDQSQPFAKGNANAEAMYWG